jgi:phosphatidylinositol-bisphosphatase
MSREGKHQTKNLIELEDEFIEHKPINIFCGTFNLAGQDPSESLAPWLKNDNTEIDVYAIGFQEIVDLTTTSLLLKTDWAKKEAAWTDAVNNQLLNSNPRSYKLISTVRMFGLYLLLYADENLSSNISDVCTSVLATGVLTMGNKGSIGISLKVHQSRISFVCSHFAAHTQYIEKRNADFRLAWSNLKFQDGAVGLEQHDVIFWFGDLNYRIDQLSVNDTLKLINSNSFGDLLNYDQLTNERAKLAAFESFNEGEMNFKPTFKFKIKTNLYEKEANLNVSQTEKDAVGNKVKLPSWTDRVLWKTVNNKVELIEYASVNRITLSDHKPVYAVFKAEVKKINNEELRKAISELFTQLDKKSNEEMPHVSIDKKEFLFENCMFYDTRAQYFNVKNDGVSACNIEILYHDSFNKRIDDTEDYISNINKSFLRPRQPKQWVSVLPQYKERVQPYSSFRVKLNLSFTFDLLPQLNKSQIMEDFLIVKSIGGKHNFLSFLSIDQFQIVLITKNW